MDVDGFHPVGEYVHSVGDGDVSNECAKDDVKRGLGETLSDDGGADRGEIGGDFCVFEHHVVVYFGGF